MTRVPSTCRGPRVVVVPPVTEVDEGPESIGRTKYSESGQRKRDTTQRGHSAKGTRPSSRPPPRKGCHPPPTLSIQTQRSAPKLKSRKDTESKKEMFYPDSQGQERRRATIIPQLSLTFGNVLILLFTNTTIIGDWVSPERQSDGPEVRGQPKNSRHNRVRSTY